MYVQGDIFNYILYRHPDGDRERLPLIVFLHGAGERGDTMEELPVVAVNGVPKILHDGDGLRCIAVSPQCPKGKYWATRVPEIRRFIEDVIRRYNADPDRVSLCGLSMGGFGTWFTAEEEPGMFSCIVPVCGGGMPWAAPVLTMPIRAFHGECDTVVLPSCSRDMIDAVLRAHPDADATLTVYPGVYHNSWDLAITHDLLEWMIAQKRQPAGE